jgi:hypothetical protein
VAPAELPALRARLAGQQAVFAQAAARMGAPLPALEPSPNDIASATPTLGDLSPGAVAHAVRTASVTLDATDNVLRAYLSPTVQPTGAPPAPTIPGAPPAPTIPGAPPAPTIPGAPPAAAPPGRATPAPLRHALIYGAYAFGVMVVQMIMFVTLDEQTALPTLGLCSVLALPPCAWAAGWLTIGALYPTQPGQPSTSRSPRLGAAICLAPNALYCAGIAVLFLTR